MTERLENATNCLIDLLRAYGDIPITVKLTQEGEEVDEVARIFIKRQLNKVGILFPHEEGKKPNTRKINDSLDKDMLSVIFHEALFEFEVAYLKDNCKGKTHAKHYIDMLYNWIENKQQWLNCTFPLYTDDELTAFPEPPAETIKQDSPGMDAEKLQKEIEYLNGIGFGQIANQTEMMQLFWTLAMRGKLMDITLRAAINAITTEKQAMRYFSNNYRAYNRTIQKHWPGTGLCMDETKNKTANRKQEAETNDRVHAVRKELNEKIRKLRTDGSGYKKVARKLKALLDDPKSDFQMSYDLNCEEDIDNYLSWYRLMKRVVKASTVKSIEKFRYPETGVPDLFRQKVEMHNAEFQQAEENAEKDMDMAD